MVSLEVCRGLIDTFTADMYHVVRYLADPGEARGCSKNSVVIN